MPILREGELDIISLSADQTQRLGMRLGQLLQPGDIVCLSGDMGAGKTVFAAGLGTGWGASTPLTSPTYNLVHQHRREADGTHLHHLDCYRLHGEHDADSIGIDTILDGNGVVVIEWAEQIEATLPEGRLWVELRVVDETRRNIIFEGEGQHYLDLVEQFRQAAFGV